MDSRLFHFIVKEFRQLGRDPRMLRVVLIMPVIQLLMFGYIASMDIKNTPTAVMDEDRSSLSRAYIRGVGNSGSFDLKYNVNSEGAYEGLLDSGKAAVLLHIPRDFKKKLMSGDNADVQVILDGSNSSTATILLSYLNIINANFNSGIIKDRMNRAGLSGKSFVPYNMEARVWYNPQLKSLYFMVPAIFAQILMMISMMLTMTSMVKEKERGTIEQLIVTPVRPYEILLGKMIPPVTVAFVDTVLAFLVAILWFRIPMHGSVLLLFALGIIFSVTGLGIGLLISTFSRNQREAMMTNTLIMSPQMILSGFMFPIASMPVLVQWLTYAIPLRYFLVIVRSIFLKGVGVKYLISEIWPMFIIISAVLVLSVVRFHKKMD